MKINIEVIPHGKQRYPTIGDWFCDPRGTMQIRVSDMGNWKYEFLVALHELIKVILCKAHNIKEREVDLFNLMFEEERKAGKHSREDEAGEDPRCPYYMPHFWATNLERILACILFMDWDKYSQAVSRTLRGDKC